MAEQGRTDAAIGVQTMFGSPVNAQDQANIVDQITSGQGTVQQATHRNDFVSGWFSYSLRQGASNQATGGNADTSGLDAHSSYTGSLPTSTSIVPQIPGLSGLPSPLDIQDKIKRTWGPDTFSRPEIVLPQR